MGRDVAPSAPAHLEPVWPADDPLVGVAGNADRAVILLRAVNAEGPVVVGSDVIELRGRLVVLLRPGLAAVHRDGHAAVVAVHDAVGVGGIDPEAVVVSVRRGQPGEFLAAVGGAEGAGVQDIYSVNVLRVGEDVAVVPGALGIALVVVHATPGVASIVGAIEAAFFRLDHGVHAVGVRAGDRNADAA